jgi:AcrR family transcriptional regulator
MYSEHMGRRADWGALVEAAPLVAPGAVRETGSVKDVVKQESRGSLREEHKRLTRNRVLDAAVAVLAEKAFVDTTMEDIAKAAGTTRVTVYAHFPGKGDIVQALAERVYDTMSEVYADLAGLPQWTRAALHGWLGGAAERWRAMAPTLRVAHVAGAMAGAHDYTNSRNRYVEEHERYAAMLTADPQRWRGVPPAQARQRAVMAVLQSESFLTTWLAAGLPLATDDPLDLLADSLYLLLNPSQD